MQIIVLGLGKVGGLLTQYISEENHDVTVIDLSASRIDEYVNQYDVIGVCGNGATKSVLMEAGADKADIMICVTSSDELNILAGLIAQKLGTKNIIARVRKPEYSKQVNFMKEQLGFSMIVNPELEAANDIIRTLAYPSAVKVEVFSKGKVEVVDLFIDEDSKLNNVKLSELNKITKANILVCAVNRKQHAIIPDGNFVIQNKDHVYVTGLSKDLVKFFNDINLNNTPVKNAMIIGGGTLGYYLAQNLAIQGIKVKIIENNSARAVHLARELPFATVIEANGIDEETLIEEGIMKTDSFISLTGLDEQNLVLTLYAKQFVHKTIAKVTRVNLTGISDMVGITSVVSPKTVIANQILKYIRTKSSDDSNSVLNLYKIVDGKVEIVELEANNHVKCLNTPLSKIKTKDNTLIAAIIRNGEFILPRGNTCVEDGDHVLVVTSHHIESLNGILMGE